MRPPKPKLVVPHSSYREVPEGPDTTSTFLAGGGKSHSRQSGVKLVYGYCAIRNRGGLHPMEDFVVAEMRQAPVEDEEGLTGDIGLFGIFDGHGGSQVAWTLKQRLFNKALHECGFWVDPAGATRDAYLAVNNEVLRKGSTSPPPMSPRGLVGWSGAAGGRAGGAHEAVQGGALEADMHLAALVASGGGAGGGGGGGGGEGVQEREGLCGATAATVLAFAGGTRMVVANVGDVRVVLGKVLEDGHGGHREARQLSTDHDSLAPRERADVEHRGGRVVEAVDSSVGSPRLRALVDGIARVSRAFGDAALRRHLSARPDVRDVHVDPSEDECVVVAPRSVWEALGGNQALVETAGAQPDPQVAAQRLCEAAIAAGAEEDVSCVVVRFEEPD